MPESTTANVAHATSSPAGDLAAELNNLLEWTDQTENADVSLMCTFTTFCCHQF